MRLCHRMPGCYKSPSVSLDVISLCKLKFIYEEKIDQKKILLTKITNSCHSLTMEPSPLSVYSLSQAHCEPEHTSVLRTAVHIVRVLEGGRLEPRARNWSYVTQSGSSVVSMILIN